ncbi:MAG: hypothetical protein ABSA47_12865 [Verrucomicrobiota bacterium]
MKSLKLAPWILAIVIILTGPSAFSGSQTNANQPVEGEVFIKGNGSRIPFKAQFVEDGIQIGTNSVRVVYVLREARTGYVWWDSGMVLPSSTFYVSHFTALMQEGWRQDVGVVDGLGIVSLSERSLAIYNMQTSSLQEVKKQVSSGIETGQTNSVWPLDQHCKVVKLPLRETSGDDYAEDPYSSAPTGNYIALVSLMCTNSILSIKIKSNYAPTNAFAVVDLDSDVKIIKATRSSN